MTENETAELITKLYKALDASADHHTFCGYGDSYEQECAYEAKLPEMIEEALEAAHNAIPSLKASV